MTETTDWREMEAGIKLDIEIVQRLPGWQIKYVREGSQAEYDDEHNILPPQRVTVTVDEDGPIFFRGPRFSTDANAALSLFANLPDDLTPRVVRILEPMGDHMSHVWSANIIVFNKLHFEREFGEEADTPALAICRAWLAWRETQ